MFEHYEALTVGEAQRVLWFKRLSDRAAQSLCRAPVSVAGKDTAVW